MRILFCVDIFRNGGLETNIITFARYLIENGDEVFLCTDKESYEYSTYYTNIFKKIFYLNDTSFTTFNSLRLNSENIQALVNSEKIDFLVIHPFNSFLYAVHASILLRKPYVLFFHGPSSVNPDLSGYYKDFFDFWVKNVSIKNSNCNFCVSKEVQLLLKSKYDDIGNKAMILKNPIPDLKKIKSPLNVGEYILLASRIDESKYNSIMNSINFFKSFILENESDLKMYIAGSGNKLDYLHEYVRDCRLEESVKILGFKEYPKLLSLMKGSKIVMGMGRVCLEGIALHKNVILTGYDGIKGFIKDSNIKKIGDENFSGRNMKNVNNKRLMKECRKILKNGDLAEESSLYLYVMDNYHISSIGKKFYKIIVESFNNNVGENYDELAAQIVDMSERFKHLLED